MTTMKLDDFVQDKGTVVMCFEPAPGLTICRCLAATSTQI